MMTVETEAVRIFQSPFHWKRQERAIYTIEKDICTWEKK